MEVVRIGVIGTSWWMDFCDLPAIQSHPRARLQAVCGRKRERAEALAKKYGCETVYTDYEVILSHPEPD